MNPVGHGVVARVVAARDRAASGRSVLVAVTGIDGAGKGYLSARLGQALQREGIQEDTIVAYRTIYFPAQEIHIARDAPQSAATAIIDNDPRRAAATAAR